MSSKVHFLPALPVVVPSSITFSSDCIPSTCCQWKNKYGEYVCKHEVVNYKFCEHHYPKFNRFYGILKHLTEIYIEYVEENFIVPSFKILLNLINYVLKYKELLVNCSMNHFTKILTKKYWYILEKLQCEKIHRNFKFHKSKTIDFYINEMLKFKFDIVNHEVELQIKKSRSELISNSIKIQKLSEIYIKSNSKDICPVICRGIDKNILSFIV